MRVVVVTPWFPQCESPSSGVFVQRDVLALSAEHEIRVVHVDAAYRGAPALDNTGTTPVLHLPFDRRNPAHWAWVVRRVRAATTRADVVHTHALTGIAPFAMRRPARSAAWVHTEHWSAITNPETLPAAGRLALRTLLPLESRPDVVAAVSGRLADAIRPHRGGPLRVVPCIVESPDRVLSAPRGDVVRLIGVGAITPRKGPLLALESLAELDRLGVRATLTWVGEGPERDALVRRAEELRLTDRLVLTGTLDRDGVGRALDNADLFLLPTQGDNFCVSVAEALAHGRPVVSGAATGAHEYSPPDASRFVGAQTPAAYATAVTDLLRATEHLPAAEIAAHVTRRFAPSTVAAQYGEIYAEALAARPR